MKTNKLLAFLLSFMLCFSLISVSSLAESTGATEILVMTTTDMHGKCWNVNPLTDGTVRNSFLKVATLVKQNRSDYENTVLIDNGDLYQGTPIASYYLLQAVTDDWQPNPMAVCLTDLDYDAAVMGNHEFNYNWDAMLPNYEYLDENGVPVLAANLYKTDSDGNPTDEQPDDIQPYTVKTFTVDGQEFKVGILGIENTDCDKFDVPQHFGGLNENGYPNLTLSISGNDTRDMAIEVQKWVDIMRSDAVGCDAVIVSYHSGLGDGNETGDLTLYTDTENQIARVAYQCTGIDLIVAGHDHDSSYSGTLLDRADGGQVMVVNGGSSQLTQTLFSVTYSEADGFSMSVSDVGNIDLGATTGDYPNQTEVYANDEELAALISPYVDTVNDYVNASYGTATGDWDASTDYKLGQNDTIDLINRAEIWSAKDKADIDLDVATTTCIVANDYVIAAGPISLKDIYQIYKYDNSLYVVNMTGAQLKDWMENISLFYSVDNGAVVVENNYVTALFYGVDFTYDLSKEAGSRVTITDVNGKGFSEDATYTVGVNNYLIGQDPFVSAMGKTSDNKGDILTDALWSSNDAYAGGTESLITQMIANYVAYETEANGGVTAAPSNWSVLTGAAE